MNKMKHNNRGELKMVMEADENIHLNRQSVQLNKIETAVSGN